MRRFLIFILVLAGEFAPNDLHAQIDNNGCVLANFGIDGDLYSDRLTYGSHGPVSPLGTDDWFNGVNARGVIQELDTAAIRQLLLTNPDPRFEVRMKAPFGIIDNGRTLIDAVYARDNFGGTGFIDQTAFPVSSKNGQDPAIWSGGPANVLGKNDIIDVGAHMRRNGPFASSPLFLFGTIARAEPGGAAYMDMEFFIQDVQFNPASGFTTGGPDEGHTAFQFDAQGRLTRMGDMVVNIALEGGGTETNLEVRIWVKRSDRLGGVTPALFDWGVNFDGASQNSTYVYAAIVPKTTGAACGYVNLTGQLSQAPPWGHKGQKTNQYFNFFDEFALAEYGINLSEFGLDPAFVVGGVDSCFFPYKSFCAKTRSSASFTAALKDFAGPYQWGKSRLNLVSGGMLSCLNPTTTITPNYIRNDISYQWSTTDGRIVGASNTAVITVDRVGTYTLTATMPNGCTLDPASFYVVFDADKPFITGLTKSATLGCAGNNATASVAVEGGKAPFTVSWSGPAGYTGTGTSLAGLVPGMYYINVTDVNGCTFSDSLEVPAATPVVPNPTVEDVRCAGQSTGNILLSPTGKAPLSYLWSNGQTVQNLRNVPAGTYTVNITDGDGCVRTFQYTINQPVAIQLTLSKVDDSNPDVNVGNGTITAQITGGTAPLSYAWTGPSGFVATTQNLTGLKAGTYQLTVTDANSCTRSASIRLFEPEICNDGIDNDGNNLTDCDDPVCKPATPSVITASKATPCVGDTVIYSVVNVAGLTYEWTLPNGATLLSGQGTNSIQVKWTSTQGGLICVRANNVGCLSEPRCNTVAPDDKPATPNGIRLN